MRAHFIGIGGIGMSGLARLLLEAGWKISGSDIRKNSLTQSLAASGAQIYAGHRAEQVGDANLVIYSSAISEENPELRRARERAIPLQARGELSADIVNRKELAAIAGTHGKTTTTALTAELLLTAGLDPTILIGGMSRYLGTNSYTGSGEWALIESDESDASFLWLFPRVAVITNIEEDHLPFYGSLRNIRAAFASFAGNTRTGGCIIHNGDDPVVRGAVRTRHPHRRLMSFGLGSSNLLSAVNLKLETTGSSFAIRYRQRVLGDMCIRLPGAHNVYNALGAIGVALWQGIQWDHIKKALEGFRGIRRRLDQVGWVGTSPVFDDYAHHPTEIRATLAALDQVGTRLIAVWQPHRYSRLEAMLPEFLAAFGQADVLIVTPLYAAGEKPRPAVSDERIYQALTRSRQLPTIFAPSTEQIAAAVKRHLSDNSKVVFLGAGDITNTAAALVQELE